MLLKLPKFLKVAQKTVSCSKVAEQLVDRAKKCQEYVPLFAARHSPALLRISGYIASNLRIIKNMGACHILSNCFDHLSKS